MAEVDDNEKAFSLALQASDLSGRLMSTLRTFVDVSKLATSSGITFSGKDYSGTALKFCTGDDIQTAIANAESLLSYLETNYISSVFDKVTKS